MVKATYTILAATSLFVAGVAQEPNAPTPATLPTVNYSNPRREYEFTRAGEWSVMVERQLQTDAPEVARKALSRLNDDLAAAMGLLPRSSHRTLKKVHVILLYGPKAKGGGRDGLGYVRKWQPDTVDVDPRWRSGIVINHAEEYMRSPQFRSLKHIVHEMAHAYHMEQWPEDQVDIRQAWNNATKQGLYRDVKDWYGGTLAKAYAATNPLEYFAELSCMYFVGCESQPFNRRGLKTYDPAGYAMIEKMWGLESNATDAIALAAPAGPSGVASVDGRTHVVAIHNGVLRHSLLSSEGTFTSWASVCEKAGAIGEPTAVACAAVGKELHVVVIAGSGLFHTFHSSAGWQRFTDVKAEAGNCGSLEGASVSCASDGKTLIVVVTRSNGWIITTERYGNGSWKKSWAQPSGEKFVSKEGKYAIQFPGKPTETIQASPSPRGERKQFRAYYITAEGHEYRISYVEYPKDYHPDVRLLFDAIRDDLKGKDGKLVSEKNVEFGSDKVSGRDIHIDRWGRHVRDRVLWRTNRLYHVMVTGPEKFVTGTDAGQFLESVELTK